MIAKQTVFLSADRSKAVPEGDKDAKFLLVREGQEIADADVEKHDCAALVNASPNQAKAPASESVTHKAPKHGK